MTSADRRIQDVVAVLRRVHEDWPFRKYETSRVVVAAMRREAERRRVRYATVADACRRRLGIRARRFNELVFSLLTSGGWSGDGDELQVGADDLPHLLLDNASRRNPDANLEAVYSLFGQLWGAPI